MGEKKNQEQSLVSSPHPPSPVKQGTPKLWRMCLPVCRGETDQQRDISHFVSSPSPKMSLFASGTVTAWWPSTKLSSWGYKRRKLFWYQYSIKTEKKFHSFGFTLAQHALLENLLSCWPGSSSARPGTWIFVADPNILALGGLHSLLHRFHLLLSIFLVRKNPTATAVFLFFEGEPFQWKPLRTCSQRLLSQILLPLDRGKSLGCCSCWLRWRHGALMAFLPSTRQMLQIWVSLSAFLVLKGEEDTARSLHNPSYHMGPSENRSETVDSLFCSVFWFFFFVFF